MRIKNIFYYSTFYLVGIGLALLTLLCNQGCRDCSNEQSAASAKKQALVGKPAPYRPKPVRPKSDLPPPSDEVVVKVIDAGKKPQKKIRYRFRAGSRNKAQVTISEKISVNANGKQLPPRVSPPVSFELTASVDSAPKSSASKLKLVFGRPSISNVPPNGPSTIVAQMLSTLDGVPGIQTVTNVGAVESTDIVIPEGDKPGVRKLWQGTQRIAQNLIRFPEEPIGVGAQWEVIQDVELATSARQTAKYKLVTLDRRGGTVQAEVNQIGRPGLVPEMSNKNIENYLDAFKSTGVARLDFKFNSGISIGKVTTTTNATYTSESDTEDKTTEYHTVQTVEIKRAIPDKKPKK